MLLRVSMRWWLALVFAAIAAVTAVAVAQVLTVRSENAFRERARDLAAGAAVTAAAAISGRGESAGLPEATARAAQQRSIALFVFDAQGRLLTSPSSNGVAVDSLPEIRDTMLEANGGHRTVGSVAGGRRIVVGLPLRSSPETSLVAVASRPDLVAAGNILRGQLFWTLTIAIGLGALVGILIAWPITARLRRIGRAAARIETGDFDAPLTSRFHDELGQLAESVDSMRLRLRDSFTRLESERNRLRDLLEQLQEGVIAVDSSLHVVYANARAELMVGRSRLVPGSRLPALWPDIDLDALVTSLFYPGSRTATFRVSPQEGYTFAVAGIPARGSTDTALLVITDVTVTVRRERAEREFVANAAHELRTPLAAIASAVDVLQSGAKDVPDERDRFLAVVERQSERLARLVRSLLALARAQTHAEHLATEPVDVAALLDEVAAELPAEVPVETSCEPGLSVLAHHELLLHAVGNLASNALKHADGAPVELEAHRLRGSLVRIAVLDHGKGIPEGDRERVLDRFYRGGDRDGDGFGIGLSIAREVALALGGEIEIAPREGGGTVAALVLQESRLPA